MGLYRVNTQRLALLGVFLGVVLAVVGVGLQFGGPVAMIVGGVTVAVLCAVVDFDPAERE